MKIKDCPAMRDGVQLIIKYLLIMKLVVFIALLTSTQAIAIDTFSQERISLKQSNIAITSVLKGIEERYDYRFVYSDSVALSKQRIDVYAKNAAIDEVMQQLLETTGFSYKRMNKGLIVIIGNEPEQAAVPVKATVVDDAGAPVPGANIVEKGTTNGAVTKEDGSFLINVKDEQAVLVISVVGFVAREIPVSQLTATIVLERAERKLEEVIVVGYGTQKKVNLTGAVSTISGQELVKRPAANPSLLLQGKVPGLQVVQNSAQPGLENPSIQIHGVGTFSSAGNNPLVLIDGIPGSLTNVNPNAIENISVLKDAASAAIYGVQAANGVILVTTKTGTRGRLNVDYSYNWGLQKPSGVPQLIWNSVEFMELSNEGINRTGQNLGKLYTQAQIDAYRNGNGSAQYPNTDWTKLMFRNAPIQQHYLSVNGGEGKTTYNFGLGYLDQDGILIKTGYKRYNAQFNFRTQMSKVIGFGSNISFMQGNRMDPFSNTENLVLSIYAQHPLWSPYLPDGSGRVTSKAYDFETTNQNAYAVMQTSKDYNKAYSVMANSYVDVNIAKGLKAQVKGGVTYNTDRQTRQNIPLPTFLFQPDVNGVYAPQQNYLGTYITLTKTQQEDVHYTFYSTLTYDRVFNDVHHFTALGGYNQENFSYEQLAGFRRDFPSENLPALNAGGTDAQTTNGYGYEWALKSFFGRLNYAFDSRYLFEVSLREDGSSRFREGRRWGAFPSMSAGWRVSQENFMKGIAWLSNLKIRGSWGRLGNQNIGNYPYQNLLDNGIYIYDKVATGVLNANLADSNITWETTTAAGIGVDFALFHNKLSGTFDYFSKQTKNILRIAQVPAFVGMGAPTINSGAMENKGFEFSLDYKDRFGEVDFFAGANYYTYKNRVTKLGAEEIQSNKLRREGLPWNSWYMWKWIGVFQNQEQINAAPKQQYAPKPGDLIFADLSGPDGAPDGKVDAYDRVVIPGQYPKFNYGFNLGAAYKGFDLTVFFQGVAGIKVYTDQWGYGAFRQWSPPPTFWRDRWTPDNPTNKLPGMYVDQYMPITAASSFWLQDASYLRLKNLVLGYNFNSRLLQRMKMQQLRVYFSGDNLLTFSDFEGDPERVITDNTSGRFAIYPQASVYTFGVKVTF
ncbi:TonB-dependent receptor [Niabella sp. CC-SYL272]|uniref:TonB-dependent receptor n=1 Tax=Niabella agricola TaxID=2891571 RepID=UPI001F430DEB|nr:TonB-dependent receptor [Niabella agricola]MCF3111828.1 TonB-dependent receptor [Niabella agricola]